MSTALAIASVTAVLKDLLNNGLIDHDVSKALAGDVAVTALPPDRIETGNNNGTSQLALFLYHVSPNTGWRNVGLPSRDSRGDRTSNPPLAIDLHYLLIAYGAQELDAEILLGYGMQLLHETPVLTREAIRRSLAPPSIVASNSGIPDPLRELSRSELAEQVELIKITPHYMTTDEIGKLWAAFQTTYRPLAAYVASVVLIESRQSARTPLPVLTRAISVVPNRHPHIEKVMSQTTAGAPIAEGPVVIGTNLVLRGEELSGEDPIVRVGTVEAAPSDVSATQIIVPLTDPALMAGAQGVQVVLRLKFDPADTVTHELFESNAAAFVLRPRIDNLQLDLDAGDPALPRSGRVTVRLAPKVTPAQRGRLVLNEMLTTGSIPPGEPAAAYSFVLPPRTTVASVPTTPPDPTDTVVFPITNVKSATYLVRIQIDGAESVPASNAAGFTGPTITV